MDNSISLLTSINGYVKSIAESMSPKNGDKQTASAIRNVNQGGVNPAPKENGAGETISVKGGMDKNMKDTLQALPGIVKSISSLKIKDVVKFNMAIKQLMKGLETFAEGSKKISGANSKAVKDVISSLDGIDKVIKALSKSAKRMPLAIISMKLLGTLIDAYAKVAKKAGKISKGNVNKLTRALNSITKMSKAVRNFAVGMVVLVGALLLVGVLITKAWEPILVGLAAVLALTVIMGGVALFMGLVTKTMIPIGKDAIKSLVYFLGLAVGLIMISALVGVVVTSFWPLVLIGMATIVATTMGIMALAAWMGKIGMTMGKGAVQMTLAIKNIAWTFLLSGAIVVLAAGVGAIVKKNYMEALIGIGVMVAVLGASILLLKAVDVLMKGAGKNLVKTTKSLLFLEAALGAAALVAVAAVLLGKALKKDPKWTIAALGVMASILGGCLLVLKALGKINVDWKGVAMLAIIEGIVFASTLVAFKVIDLGVALHKAPDGSLLKALALMAGLIVGVGAITFAAGALVMGPQALLFAAGAAAIAVILAVVGGIIDVCDEVVKLVTHIAQAKIAVDEAGGGKKLQDFIRNDIRGIMNLINGDNFNPDMSIFTAAKLALKYDAIASLGKGIQSVASAIAALASVGASIDDQGRIHPIKKKNPDGSIIYDSRGVDVVRTTRLITKTLMIFVKNTAMGAKEAQDFMRGSKALEVVGSLVEPIDKFAEMVSLYESCDGKTLKRIEYDEKGNVKKTKDVDIAKTAQSIANAFSTFINIVYSQGNLDAWANLIANGNIYTYHTEHTSGFIGIGAKDVVTQSYAGNNFETVSKIIGNMLGPIATFAEMVAMYEGDDEGNLTRVVYDEKGRLVEAKPVKVAHTAKVICDTLLGFVKQVYGPEGLLGMVGDITKFKDSGLGEVISYINEFSNSISSFANNSDMKPKRLADLKKSLETLVSFIANPYDLKGKRISLTSYRPALYINELNNSIVKFDDILYKGAAQRNKKLKEFSDAVKNLSDKVKEAGKAFEAINSAVRQINNLDASKVDKLNKFASSGNAQKISDAAKGVDALAGGLSVDEVKTAITQALDGTTITKLTKTTKIGKSGREAGKDSFVIDTDYDYYK